MLPSPSVLSVARLVLRDAARNLRGVFAVFPEADEDLREAVAGALRLTLHQHNAEAPTAVPPPDPLSDLIEDLEDLDEDGGAP